MIPIICQLLGGDRRAITRAVLAGAALCGERRAGLCMAAHCSNACAPLQQRCVCSPGSAVPLAMFLAFNAATLAVPGAPW